MITNLLVVCTGNICRSPVAEFVLRDRFPDIDVRSAGLHALVGRDVDRASATAARHLGVRVTPHAARQFTTQIGSEADLILVMDRGHLEEVRNLFPDYSAKCFVLRHHCGGGDVPDPYKLGLANHYRAIELILEASDDWNQKIVVED
ncbi:low molecular weight phosphotyrosine protein phosphatase [Amylibacter sp.]|nr:low molecular weight phosphotyrosine protein phosphatase [Amylibacter sp.]